MTATALYRGPRRLLSTLFFAVAVVLLAFGTLTFFSPAAGAATSCGTYSFGFEGTRLLNDGISNAAGPFGVDIPAGTYTVTLVSNDHHDTQVGVESQEGEQYHVVLDSGYVSPASRDIPDSVNTVTTVFTGQVIAQSNAISVKHAGAPGINSVNVVCVGFTPEAAAVPVIEVPATVAPPSTDAPQQETPGSDNPAVAGPVVDTPGATPVTDLPVIDPPTSSPPAAKTPVEPTQDISTPVTVSQDPVEPEVKGIIETPAPPIAQLAITGPSTQAVVLIGLALAMILLGALLVREEKRLA